MDQNTAPTAPRSARSRVSTILALALVSILGLAGPSHASLLGGAETTFFNSIQGFLTGNLLPLVFVLAAVVVGAGMLIKYGRKAVSS